MALLMDRLVRTTVLSVGLVCAFQSQFCGAESIAGELIVVETNKLPSEAHQPGVSMTLHLVEPQTLYLYVEEQGGRQLAIYDVTDPNKLRLKATSAIATSGAFDFIQPAGPSLELIRYRDGGGDAMLDLSTPKKPKLRSIASSTAECYIVPSRSHSAVSQAESDKNAKSLDYQVFTPSGSSPVMTIKAVVAAQTDIGNGTTYLLGENGLTVIRNIKAEKKLAATIPTWTNTID
jgi:hypothetical protein